jgi:hypothetical protein
MVKRLTLKRGGVEVAKVEIPQVKDGIEAEVGIF